MFQSESRSWNIKHLIDKTGYMKEAILLIHAFLGCDTVSRIYGISKDKITKFPKLFNICSDFPPMFYDDLSTKLNIQEAGQKLSLGLHNQVNIELLNTLRLKIFMGKFARKFVVNPEQLPPPTDSSKYHFFRVFH